MPPSPRFKLSVALPILAVTAGAWFLSYYVLQPSMGPQNSFIPISSMSGMFAGLDLATILTFVTVWTIGMVAMMFPAMVPVISFYNGMENHEEGMSPPVRLVRSSLFLVGYLALYGLLGLILYAALFAAFQAGSLLPWLSTVSVWTLVGVLALAGIWQLSPLKEKSLAKCVSPMGFFLTHYKKGSAGALSMGAEHGVYCIGCCWAYMLVMLAVAAMSILSMVFLSGLIVVEKAIVGKSSWFKWLSSGAFFVLAFLVAAYPSFLGQL